MRCCSTASGRFLRANEGDTWQAFVKIRLPANVVVGRGSLSQFRGRSKNLVWFWRLQVSRGTSMATGMALALVGSSWDRELLVRGSRPSVGSNKNVGCSFLSCLTNFPGQRSWVPVYSFTSVAAMYGFSSRTPCHNVARWIAKPLATSACVHANDGTLH